MYRIIKKLCIELELELLHIPSGYYLPEFSIDHYEKSISINHLKSLALDTYGIYDYLPNKKKEMQDEILNLLIDISYKNKVYLSTNSKIINDIRNRSLRYYLEYYKHD